MKKKLLLSMLALTAWMMPQGAWAQTEDLTADVLYSLTTVGDGTVTGGSFSTSGVTQNANKQWVVPGTAAYVQINLNEPLCEGDIIEIKATSNNAKNFNFFNTSSGFSSATAGLSIAVGTGDAAVKTAVVTTPSTTENTLIGKSTIYMGYSSSSNNGTIHHIKVLKGVNPSVVYSSKSWDFTNYTVNATATTYNMVHDQILFGKGVSIISMTDYQADKNTKAPACTLLNIPGNSGDISNGKYIMFRVPAGKTTVSMDIVTNGNSGSKTLMYKIGNGDAVSESMSNVKWPVNKTFDVYASEETPVYIYVGGTSNTFYFKNLSLTITPAPTIDINTIDYATFSSSLALDFTGSGADAYIVTGEEKGTLTYTQVTKVKGGTGVLLVGTAGSTCSPAVINPDEATDYSATNLLKPTLTATTVGTTEGADYGKVFVLSNLNDTPGFYKSNDGRSLTVGKAYLYLENGISAARDFFPFDFASDTQGIAGVEAASKAAGSVVYDLQGRRVMQPTRGLYIMDGKKVFIK